MKINLNKRQVVSALHQDGYTDDFILRGNELFWIQEKTLIVSSEFSITKCYHFYNPLDTEEKMIIYGIAAPDHNVKGILINHSPCQTFKTGSGLAGKISEMLSYSLETK